MEEKKHHHITSYAANIWVWVALLIFTLITVTVTRYDFEALTVGIALLIATVKSTIVAIYYMHLKFDSIVLGLFFGIVIMVFLSFLLLTFFDYVYR